MATLRDTIGAMCSRLRHRVHLLRLTHLLYLVDWSSAVVQGRRVTTLKWLLDPFGPRSETLAGFLTHSREFKLTGPSSPSAIVSFGGLSPFPSLTRVDTCIVEGIVRATDQLDWPQMQRLIQQSDPVIFGEIDMELDLEYFARTRRAPPAPRRPHRPPDEGIMPRLDIAGGV